VYGGNSGEMAENVGSRPNGTSWVGAMDMSGNLLEWTSSRIQDYPYSAIIGESAGDIESYRIRRGGSFYSRVEFQRSADRSSINPAWQSRIQGFRCARDFDG
jgi:formylglycine-generating enzyme required for sulfatase activity